MKEETGLTIDAVKPAYTFTKIRKDYQTVGIGYLASTDDDHVSISFEHTDYKWCSIDELKDYLYHCIIEKPLYHGFNESKKDSTEHRKMIQIGG